MSGLPRRCERVQTHLPALVGDELPGWRRRVVERHLRRCDTCAAELAHQQAVAAELAGLAQAPPSDDVPPPEDLLASLLARAREPSLAERVAVPARGAVSGARPGLSVALALSVLALLVLAGWAGWRVGRAWRDDD